MLLHGLLVSRSWHWQVGTQVADKAFSIILRAATRPITAPEQVASLTPRPADAPSKGPLPATRIPPVRANAPATKPKAGTSTSTAPEPAVVEEPTTTLNSPSDFITAPQPASGDLGERARADIGKADRAARDDAARGNWMVKPKQLPPSLAKLPSEAKTALARSFEDHLGELVVISVVERQEGNYRMTIYETNKGKLCYYEPLVKKHFLEGMPTAGQFGTCGPKS
jgi:hypothetical protein